MIVFGKIKRRLCFWVDPYVGHRPPLDDDALTVALRHCEGAPDDGPGDRRNLPQNASMG